MVLKKGNGIPNHKMERVEENTQLERGTKRGRVTTGDKGPTCTKWSWTP
jgi:hypothetical protein